MLELKNICFERDNKKILDKVNLKLEDNKFYVITGPNGSGKSTLAKIIMGIVEADSGKIIYNGKDITKLPLDERSKLGIGFSFQQPVRFKGIKVKQLLNLAHGDKLDRSVADEILKEVGLEGKDYLDREINNSLSGGELKRIEIASIIAKECDLTIFDEPEAGIDLWSFQNLTTLFKKMQKEGNVTNLVISHQERILKIADEIILLEDGKVKDHGDKDKMLDIILK
ncbi:MAG: ATP-binding cassette domain-containing protein [Clostridia bacterium]|nr:ATP-binding cassette domain-containing protein [Clostridia bacterium]